MTTTTNLYACCGQGFPLRAEYVAHRNTAEHKARKAADREAILDWWESTADAAPASVPTGPTESGRFVTVDNGFGGTTTRRASSPASGTGPSPKSTKLLRDLLAERAGLEPAEKVRAALNEAQAAGQLTQRTVSKAIDELIAIKVVLAGSARPATRTADSGVTIDKATLPVPARGVLRFAVPNSQGEGHLTFLAFKYRSDGAIVVCQEIGGTGDVYLGRQNAGQSYRGKLANLVASVLVEPHEAMIAYGRNQRRCGHCGTKLTKLESREAGIGPVCRTKG